MSGPDPEVTYHMIADMQAESERLQARVKELEYLDTWAHLNGLNVKDAEDRAERFMQSILDGMLWSKAVLEQNREAVKQALVDQFKEQAARDQRRVQLLRACVGWLPKKYAVLADRIRAEIGEPKPLSKAERDGIATEWEAGDL